METIVYDIQAGDYTGAGAASRQVKTRLKQLGADSDAIRRAMIAAYEAEMNVVIHSHGGRLEARFGDDRLEVAVTDDGPGIPDVEMALTEGWTTASPEARALGFGAGLGLPNIRKNVDRFEVTSSAEWGTKVEFTVLLRAETQEPDVPAAILSLALHPDLCTQCRRCLTACPTGAMRVRDGRPLLLEHLCIDCADCIGVCRPGALTIAETAADVSQLDGGAVALPPAFLAGFGPRTPVARVVAELAEAGFVDIVSSYDYEQALRFRVLELARERELAHEGEPACERELARPVLAPVCPAVLNLIELRFPALIGSVAPAASPWEALWADHGEGPGAFVVSCPAQRSALVRLGADPRRLLEPQLLRDALLPGLLGTGHEATPAALGHLPADAPDPPLQVTGIAHVTAVLEHIEDGLLGDLPAIELYACSGGCYGSPLLVEDHHLAAALWATSDQRPHSPGTVAPPAAPLSPRPGIRLDDDMGRAIEKLAQLDRVRRLLPGRDCAACGAPDCAALAEDVVLQRGGVDLCPYLPSETEARQ